MAPVVSISVYSRVRRVIRRWNTRQCRSVQSIMGATEKRWSKLFISLIFYASSRSYKGLDRLANLARDRPKKDVRMSRAIDRGQDYSRGHLNARRGLLIPCPAIARGFSFLMQRTPPHRLGVS